MLKQIKRHLKDNSADVYIQMLICTTIMLLASVIIISVASSVNDKLWLDEQMTDIVHIIETTGRAESERITEIEDSIVARFGGGSVSYVGDFLDKDEKTIQLNNTISVQYHHDYYVAVNIAAFKVGTPINISKSATSNVYFKVENTQIDP